VNPLRTQNEEVNQFTHVKRQFLSQCGVTLQIWR
jgi:hypothetical protein